tara:strand:+ start:470 stop:631 length:162 start_codon:yes stop_codon:yes gene_type:complete
MNPTYIIIYFLIGVIFWALFTGKDRNPESLILMAIAWPLVVITMAVRVADRLL